MARVKAGLPMENLDDIRCLLPSQIRLFTPAPCSGASLAGPDARAAAHAARQSPAPTGHGPVATAQLPWYIGAQSPLLSDWGAEVA